MPEGGEKQALAETAGPEQDVEFFVLFQSLYIGGLVYIEVAFADHIFKIAQSIRYLHVSLRDNRRALHPPVQFKSQYGTINMDKEQKITVVGILWPRR
jgi:hypothetical protein